MVFIEVLSGRELIAPYCVLKRINCRILLVVLLGLVVAQEKLCAQDSLVVSYSRCRFSDIPQYIINEKYAVYEDCSIRKVVYPDMASFKVQEQPAIGFAIDKYGVYYRGELIETDTTGFKVIGTTYDQKEFRVFWRNKAQVFANNEALEDVDVQTFGPVIYWNSPYFKDKNSLYYFGKKIAGSHPARAIYTFNGLCYDDLYVYFDGARGEFKGKLLIPINNTIAKTRSTVVYLPTNAAVKEMDAATLKPLSARYSIDKQHVYFDTTATPIKPADFKKVRVWSQVNSCYVSDGKQVYAADNFLMDDLDASSFDMLPHSDFFFDRHGVYQRAWNEKAQNSFNKKMPFKYADPVSNKNTFITNSGRYIIYNSQAYDPWDNKLYDLTASQLAKLKQGIGLNLQYELKKDSLSRRHYVSIDDYLLKKDDKIIYAGKEYPNIDAATFKLLKCYWFYRDKTTVYRRTANTLEAITGADPETFTIFYGFEKDKNKLFLHANKDLSAIGLELLATFTGRRPGCGLDKTPSSNYYLFKNTEGYWLVQTSATTNVKYLGTAFNPKWGHVFENFELPVI